MSVLEADPGSYRDVAGTVYRAGDRILRRVRECTARHPLDVHLAALGRGLTLSDGSACTVRFLGARPTFIDTLSFRRYRDGEFWAGYVVGWDTDLSALAFERARDSGATFASPYGNAVKPAPDQGWAEAERRGLAERGQADAVLALAVVHHLAIAKNVPLDKVVAWVLDLAPLGVVEFVGKDDPRVRRLLSPRPDIFADYSPESFLAIMTARARTVRRGTLEPGGRELVWFDARQRRTQP